MKQGMPDFEALNGVPKWVGNYPVGHGGTYSEHNGGAFGVSAVNWLSWALKKDNSKASWFTEGKAEEAGWEEVASADSQVLLTFAII